MSVALLDPTRDAITAGPLAGLRPLNSEGAWWGWNAFSDPMHASARARWAAPAVVLAYPYCLRQMGADARPLGARYCPDTRTWAVRPHRGNAAALAAFIARWRFVCDREVVDALRVLLIEETPAE